MILLVVYVYIKKFSERNNSFTVVTYMKKLRKKFAFASIIDLPIRLPVALATASYYWFLDGAAVNIPSTNNGKPSKLKR